MKHKAISELTKEEKEWMALAKLELLEKQGCKVEPQAESEEA